MSNVTGWAFGSEDAHHEIDSGITHQPFAPQIGDGEGVMRPSPRRLTRGIPGNIETQTDDWRRQRRG
jgi:hypothetical protein